jgi:hypothetical protein
MDAIGGNMKFVFIIIIGGCIFGKEHGSNADMWLSPR